MIERLVRRLRGPRPVPPSVDVLTAAQAIARLERDGPAPLTGAGPSNGPLDIAVVIPPFRAGSGGHRTIAHIVRGLEARGHRCSIWLQDPAGISDGPEAFRALFGPFSAPVHPRLDDFPGADVALATGWHTVAPVLTLPGCAARGYLVQDHEPDFHPASIERLWAADSYRHGLHCLTAGSWLAEVMSQYGASARPFDLGIDHDAYRPRGGPRHDRRVLFYARSGTPRRAVPLGMLALAELHRRRPNVEIVLFGDALPPVAHFPVTNVGVVDDDDLARAYSQATVGMVLSLTNHSLVAQEMLACGLPAVELDTPSTRAAFGPRPALELAAPRATALAAALERLLAAPDVRAARAEEGLRWAAGRTWSAAATVIEAELRTMLAAR